MHIAYCTESRIKSTRKITQNKGYMKKELGQNQHIPLIFTNLDRNKPLMRWRN